MESRAAVKGTMICMTQAKRREKVGGVSVAAFWCTPPFLVEYGY